MKTLFPILALGFLLFSLPALASPNAIGQVVAQDTDEVPFLSGPRSFINGSIGSQMGMMRTTQIEADAHNQFVSELALQLKLFRVLSVVLAYNPTASEAKRESLTFQSRLRLTGQLHFLPLDVISMYLSAGMGSNAFSGLVDATGSDTSYHGGIGAEIFIGKHFAFTAEYHMLVPGIRSIQETLVSQTLETVPLNGAEDFDPDALSLDAMDPSQFIDPSNFMVTTGFRYYF